ncbi:flagellar biosynthetic protein FliO [Vagococcus hydrophili]|uniref:Flagellar biosynthesis protein FliZ n=1 Tax=Vagococcus hydrophili TaxID=2714947 RepID=A0A6G8AWS4_9ENTE|nr:flagellar biosynthetic protein FliO [Vagococcus hydrophili]QIL49343.1 hypothetical protein G7082_12985 [Vagococcus hydrophili]
MGSIFLLFKSIVFLFAIIILIKITLNYMNKVTYSQSKNIEIIEKLTVGKESSMAIVIVCQKYYLMSMTPTSNDLIKELGEEEVQQIIVQKMVDQEFREEKQLQILNTYQKTIGKLKFFRKETRNEKKD